MTIKEILINLTEHFAITSIVWNDTTMYIHCTPKSSSTSNFNLDFIRYVNNCEPISYEFKYFHGSSSRKIEFKKAPRTADIISKISSDVMYSGNQDMYFFDKINELITHVNKLEDEKK